MQSAKREKPLVPPEQQASSEQSATFLSLLYFSWLSPLLKTGYSRPLEHNDIWLVADGRAASALRDQLHNAFMQRILAKSRFPLPMAVYDTFSFDIRLAAFSQLLTAVLQVMAPFTLRYLLMYSQQAFAAKNGNGNAPAVGVGVGYAVSIAAMLAIQNVSLSHFYYRGMLMGGKVRSALIALVFEKSLRLSQRARCGREPDSCITSENIPVRYDQSGWSNGRMMALISTDVKRIEQGCEFFHLVWTSALQIGLTVALLIVNLGVSSLAGVAVLVCGLGAGMRITGYLIRSRAAINVFTDQRASLTQEMFHAVRFIKYFAWEEPFLDRLKSIRAAETGAYRTMHFIKSALEAWMMAMPIFANMMSLIVYSVTGHELNPSSVWSVVALINGLRTPINWLPQAIGYSADALTAMKKIEGFLLAEEISPQREPKKDLGPAVLLEHASFTWEATQEDAVGEQGNNQSRLANWRNRTAASSDNGSSSEKDAAETSTEDVVNRTAFSLKDLSLSLERGELIAIVGEVGSGKTSLLSALAGEMRQTDGIFEVCARPAFCPQYAWMQNASIRENVVFGKTFESELYARVVQACALLPDFAALPDGDETEVGERGITLSGGQRQRVNIARAVYSSLSSSLSASSSESDAHLVLLDDPLSAVDANVGTHIFNEAICGLLKGRCIIMATHQLHTLVRCDKVIRMLDGHIVAFGTCEELMAMDTAFARQMTLLTAGFDRTRSSSQLPDAESEPVVVIRPEPGDDILKTTKPLMQDDIRAVHSVSWAVLIAWIRASGSVFNILWVLVTQIIFRGANILTSVWISWWISDRFGLTEGEYVGIYAGLAVTQGLLLFTFSVITATVGTKASQSMSNQAMWQILRAPMAFFDTTPLGRIMHRFTADIDITDNATTESLRQFLICSTSLLAAVLLIVVYFYWFAIAIAVSVVALAFIVNYYRSSARELKRLHSLRDGVVFARFGEALVGASCIGAYSRERDFTNALYHAIDDMNAAYFLTFANQRWLALRLDSIGTILMFITAVLVVSNALSVSPSNAGLALSYSFSLSGMIQITIKYLTQLDNCVTSTERLHQYSTEIAIEGNQSEPKPTTPAWPEYGRIEYKEVQMRYRPELPLVIDNFNLTVEAGERIGIVGRTGAGKSTVLSMLFRMTELAGGRIFIDGVDISHVSLYDLRSRLAVIPQDPTLFKGTIRSNLDPESRHSDLKLWDALRQSHLLPQAAPARAIPSEKTPLRESHFALDNPVEENGLNFSLGQRQLLALARALLRDSRIVLVDEGTSSVDAEADAYIQAALAQGLVGKTLIAIAHRLRTVLLYDRVCVMEQGVVAELGRPLDLWQLGGIFRQMCDRNGIIRGDFRDRER